MPEDTRTTVALAGLEDIKAIAALFAAMDLHYQGRTLPTENWEQQAASFLNEADNGMHYAIAWLNGEPAGIACFVLFRHGLIHNGSVFLKDLFVLATARGSGTGEALMAFVARFALDHGAERIDLTVDVPNTGAARFYDRLGGEQLDAKRFYRFDAEAVASLANRD